MAYIVTLSAFIWDVAEVDLSPTVITGSLLFLCRVGVCGVGFAYPPQILLTLCCSPWDAATGPLMYSVLAALNHAVYNLECSGRAAAIVAEAASRALGFQILFDLLR